MESETGSTLTIVGGILWLIISFLLILTSLGIIIYSATKNSLNLITLGVIFLTIGIIFIILGTLGVKAAQWMKTPQKTKKAGILSLIIGILGINILTLIGSIIALVDSKK